MEMDINKNVLRFCLTSILYIICFYCFAQPYVIQSKDGFANIRESGNINAKIIQKLKSNTVILIDQTEDQDVGNDKWLKILYYENRPFSILKDSENKEMETGYVHISQIIPLESLEIDNSGALKMNYSIGSFIPKNYKITYHDETQNFINTINDYHYYLSDCGTPKTAITNATAVLNKTSIPIPDNLWLGIISAQNDFQYFKTKDALFAYQGIGDGSCYNHVVWVFQNGKLIQRFIGWEY